MRASILVVEDDVQLAEALRDTLELVGHNVVMAADGNTAIHCLEDNEIKLVVSDIQMENMDGIQLLQRINHLYPEMPVVLMTAYGSIQQAVAAIQAGARDYLVKPFEPQVLVSKVSQFMPGDSSENKNVIASDRKTRSLLNLAAKVAKSDATILVTGESGTGKEVFVQHIHNSSARKNKPFVAINCAAIPDNMLEAMLFGYQKGAFTGAYKSCPGKFEQAQGGTLLLDEISEMNLGLQAKLLRVLQEREVERLGDQKMIPLDVRVMATSNRNMQQQVAEGGFREDLYYRLNVFRLEMPALRERPGDILPLAMHFLERDAGNTALKLTPEAEQKLMDHDWPGNIRELDNVMQRALIFNSGESIEAEDIRFEELAQEKKNPTVDESIEIPETLGNDLRVQERQTILRTLEKCHGSRKHAAETLGISPRTLRYKLARMRDDGIAVPG